MILSDVGEIGIHHGAETFRLRPSFYAMSRLGPPELIVAVFTLVMDTAIDLIAEHLPDELPKTISFRAAWDVLRACWDSAEEDLVRVLGRFSSAGYEAGAIPAAHVFPLARCLLKHGLVGDAPPLRPAAVPEDKKFTDKFVARDHVAFAMAHLGLNEREAWGMTMTGLVLTLRAKFPELTEPVEPRAGVPPTKAEHEQTMEWFEKIDAKRKLAQGVKRG
jgi:hypothetical protein